MPSTLSSNAIVFTRPGALECRVVNLAQPGEEQLVVDVEASGISTGTEKLLWRGTMPAFPGLGYPLVPGYEAVGTVREAGAAVHARRRLAVCSCRAPAAGGRRCAGCSARAPRRSSSPRSPASRPIGDPWPPGARVLLALAATAMHTLTARLRHAAASGRADGDTVTLARLVDEAPELIVGHGVLGRLLARICRRDRRPAADACGRTAPARARDGARVTRSSIRPRTTVTGRRRVTDVSGAGGDAFDTLIATPRPRRTPDARRLLRRAGELRLPARLHARGSLSVAAEWAPDDLALVLSLVEADALDLGG